MLSSLPMAITTAKLECLSDYSSLIIDTHDLLLTLEMVYSTWLGLSRLIFFVLLFTISYREWRDPNWTTVVSAQSGIDGATREQRRIIFGKNEIDIGEKSTLSLLVEEVGRNLWLSTIN
jgi:hypothetical protein